MSSLHTKYRPQALDEVVGQEAACNSLRAQLADGSQQAFLFEGPSGTGKTTLARICANMLGTTELIEIDAATHTGVDSMRDVASRAGFVSLEGGAKAFIVDECHRLSKQAWESLLKDIEEPPEGVYWFFCTTEGNKVPKTIRTRCVAHTLREVPWRKLVGLLQKVAQEEGLNLSDEIIDVAAETADGSPRQALVNLSAIAHCPDQSSAEAALQRASSPSEAFDLAKLLINPQFDFAKACALLKSMKDMPPESIRHVVRAYATTTILGSPDNRWARGVLLAFEAPAVEQNQISDILCRVITMEKWKR